MKSSDNKISVDNFEDFADLSQSNNVNSSSQFVNPKSEEMEEFGVSEGVEAQNESEVSNIYEVKVT